MGRRLALALLGRGLRTRVLCLPGEVSGTTAWALERAGVEVVAGDVTRPETLGAALAGVATVYHLAALILSPGNDEALHRVNAEGTRHVVAAAKVAGVGHFILVSSISVLYSWSNAYARSKREAEMIAGTGGIANVTILRPSLAYEDGGSAEFIRFVDHLRRGPVVLLPGGGRARKSPVHVEDLVQGFTAVADNPKAYGRVYHLTGEETITLREMAGALLAHMGRPKPVLGVPLWLCLAGASVMGLLGRLTGRRGLLNRQSLSGLVQDAVHPDPAAREDLGYRPRTFRAGLAALTSLKDCLRK